MAGTNTALALPFPPVVPVKVTVAVPAACIVVCADDSVPFTGALKVMGCPTRAVRLAGAIASLRLLERKLAVMVEIAPTHIGDDDAVFLKFNQRVGVAPKTDLKLAVVTGPVFTPHQLLSTFKLLIAPPLAVITLPSPKLGIKVVLRFGEVLLNNRLKLIFTVCALVIAIAAPPYCMPLAVLFKKVFLNIFVVTGPVPPPVILRAPPCVAAVLPVNVQLVIVTLPIPL